MPSHKVSDRDPLRLSVLISLLCLLLWVATAPAANAHSELVSSTPENNTELTEPPSEVVLEFNEEMEPIGTKIAVADPNGDPVSVGEPVLEGTVITQAISAEVAGDYTVVWRTVSADGHPISGEFTFTLTGAPAESTSSEAPASEAPASEAPASEAPASTSPDSSTPQSTDDSPAATGTSIGWILGGAGVAILLAVIIVMVRRNRS